MPAPAGLPGMAMRALKLPPMILTMKSGPYLLNQARHACPACAFHRLTMTEDSLWIHCLASSYIPEQSLVGVKL